MIELILYFLQLESGSRQKLRNRKRITVKPRIEEAPGFSYSAISLGPRRIFETWILCLRPDLYSKIYRNSVSHKAIILHLINNFMFFLIARGPDGGRGGGGGFWGAKPPSHALLWCRHCT